ncbi:MAG: hypothetical protein L7F77_16150 [Candidatus Magnetominusculus sp. LBB02]|nr:hypothetical protein [Candidatus Magnetominusculus sp. LBB02]
MAEIEGTDDFQQMLFKLKQRVNNISAVKTAIVSQDTGGDVKQMLASFTETLKAGFAALLDDKTGELQLLGNVAAEAKKAGDSTTAELKKEINAALNAMLADLKGSTAETSLSVKNEIASIKSSMPSVDINAVANKLNDIGDAVEALSSTMGSTVKQLLDKAAASSIGMTEGRLMQEVGLTVAAAVTTRLDAALTPLIGEVSALKETVATLKIEHPGAGTTDFTKSYIETIRSEFSGEIKEIRTLFEKENAAVKSQTLEFLSFITDRLVSLQGKVDKITRPEGTALLSGHEGADALSPDVAARISEGITTGLQREIAPVMDGLIHIIRFLVALSKR